MRAVRAALLSFSLLVCSSSFAEDAAPEASTPTEDPWQACAVVAVDPETINQSLERFEVVFGKNTLDWTDDDFQQVIDLAFACDGAMGADGTIVDAKAWGKQIQDAKEDIYGLIGIHRTIMRHARTIGRDTISLPACRVLLDYTYDDWAFTDNAKELMGQPFMAMSDRDLQRVVEHANNCLAFLPEFNKRILGGTETAAKNALYAIMDRALYIAKKREDYKFWQSKRATDVLLKVDGIDVPPTFVNQQTLKLINRYNRALSFPGGLSLETISALISIADDVIEEKASAFDVAYAEEIKRLVQQGIFDRVENKLE